MTVSSAVTGAGTASAAPAPQFASADAATIGPGSVMVTRIDERTASECTANFVFTGAGVTYLGMSAHCAGGGDETDISGCTQTSQPIGTAVVVRGRGGTEVDGTLAYSSWDSMQEAGETDDALCDYNDFALVALDPADVARLNPSVPLLGGPTALDDDGLTPGEDVYSFEPNNGGSGLKIGTALAEGPGGRVHQVRISPPGIPGDSGSGFLDSDGDAFGVLSTQSLDRARTNGVTDLALALAYAAQHGDVGQVTLVPGTEAFRAPAADAGAA